MSLCGIFCGFVFWGMRGFLFCGFFLFVVFVFFFFLIKAKSMLFIM